MVAFLQKLLSTLGIDLVAKLFNMAKEQLQKILSKKKIEGTVNSELDLVLLAKNIIAEKQKNGEPVLEEDYERLRMANRLLSSNIN